MKALSIMCLIILLLANFGCSVKNQDGENISTMTDQSSINEVIAYGSGKAFGIGVNILVEHIDSDLTVRWNNLIAENEAMGNDFISSVDMLEFYNDCYDIISNAVLGDEDPYDISGDLGEFLRIFGAEYTEDGKIVKIEPVPMMLLYSFGRGYKSGRRVAQRNK